MSDTPKVATTETDYQAMQYAKRLLKLGSIKGDDFTQAHYDEGMIKGIWLAAYWLEANQGRFASTSNLVSELRRLALDAPDVKDEHGRLMRPYWTFRMHEAANKIDALERRVRELEKGDD